MSHICIDLQDVTVHAGARSILTVPSLSIKQGEKIAIVGHNGAGKSTLLKLMTGMVQPSEGKVEVLGKRLHHHLVAAELQALRTDVAQIFQGLHLVQRLTVLENVLLGSLARNRSWLTWARIFPGSEITRAHSALQTVGLIDKAGMRTDRLSGGERQKTAIARMLMQAPSIILADEPTASLDPAAATDIAKFLCSIASEHKATLITVIHDPALVPLLADRVIGMRAGQIAFDLPIASLNDEILAQLYSHQPLPENFDEQHELMPLTLKKSL